MSGILDKAAVLNRVYAANLQSRAKTVMFYLVNRANKELTCFPAVPTIARETGMCERTVQRALKELCEEGFVEKRARYRGDGGQSSNLFVLKVKEESKTVKTVAVGDTCEVKAFRMEGKLNEVVSNMRVVDFSFFDKGSLFCDCHRVGDSWVLP